MDSLPYDILVHIFQFLPLSCRKQIRMVNRNWNNACNDISLITTEQFTIPAYYINYDSLLPEVFSTLAKCERQIINLKFSESSDELLFSKGNASGNFWRSRGSQVRSLVFSLCDIHSNTVVDILKCCRNLTDLSFYHGYLDSTDPYTEYVWVMLLNDDVIFEKVTSLTLREACYGIEFPFEALARVFPSVQKLHLCHRYGYDFSDVHRQECLAAYHEALNYVLTISRNLINLDLGFDDIEAGPSDLPEQEGVTKILAAVKQIKNLRLTQLPFFSQHHLFQLQDLKNLSTLCFSGKNTSLSVCDLLVAVLNHAPKLSHLEVTEACKFGQNENVANKLLTSSLQTLIINSKLNVEDGISVKEVIYNDTLEILRLNFSSDSVPGSINCFFIKYFRNLRDLTFVPEISRNVLEDITIHQRNLKYLEVNINTNDVSTDQPIGPQLFSFRQFKYLERLILTIDSFRNRYLFSDFVLPQLKYLEVHFFLEEKTINYLNLVNFLRAIEKLPCLEFLMLYNDCAAIPFDLVLRQCESHKNLKHLYCSSDYRPMRKNDPTRKLKIYAKLVKVLEVYKSLRYFLYEDVALYREIICGQILDVTNYAN